ncbi:uncharacterized protein LOC123699922 [Colias croceus]|uniref:uncharacterized protein LOC123699922 n=1 Tax=Colias crocea TaxID=72248 RepID=UPI001E27E9A9|nr:uncharacterized protein LOC123699922 [Colias croceus]
MSLTSVNNGSELENKLVINELLTFVQNKHEVMDSESLARICATAFTKEDIEIAKAILFKCTDKRNIKRKNKDGKNDKDLYDMIEIFKTVEPEKLPIFVARNLNKLPPITFDHVDVSRLLKDILIIQNDIKNIKNTYVTNDQLSKVREECIKSLSGNESLNTNLPNNSFQNINRKRGAYIVCNNESDDSFYLSPKPAQAHCSQTKEVNDPSAEQPPRSRTEERCNEAVSVTPKPITSSSPAGRVEARTAVSSLEQPLSSTHALRRNAKVSGLTAVGESRTILLNPNQCDARASFADTARSEGLSNVNTDSKWTIVQKKNKNRYRFIGQKGKALTNAESKFKAAEIKIPLFINNVDKATSLLDISNYIKDKTQVDVNIEAIKMRQEKEYNAYKVFVPRHKLELFLDNTLWPEGISFRRFVHFRRRLHDTDKLYNKNQNGQQ